MMQIRHACTVCYERGKNINSRALSPHSARVRNSLLNMTPPSFDLGLTQTGEEETAGECSPDTRVGNNLAAQFEMVANEEVVQDTPDRQLEPATNGKEETAGVCSPDTRLGNNLAAQFEEVANEKGVQEPARNGK